MNAEMTAPDLFESLEATHHEIYRQLLRLRVVVDVIDNRTLNAVTQALAAQVLHYFQYEVLQHHQDEEENIFPAMFSSSNIDIVTTARRLEQHHRGLETIWAKVAPHLSAAAGNDPALDAIELRLVANEFEALYLEHILLEEAVAYPVARRRLHHRDARNMGQEIVRPRVNSVRRNLHPAG